MGGCCRRRGLDNAGEAEPKNVKVVVVHDAAMDTAALKIQAVHRGNEAREEMAPCEEIAGEYLCLKTVFVRQELSMASAQVAELLQGTSVIITEVVNLPDSRRIRGRVQDPAGWITLTDTASGVVWASRAMRIPDVSSLKAGDALLAMSKITMRLHEAMDSTHVTTLAENEALEVLQICAGMRVRVKSSGGQVGWVSLRTKDGVPLLKQATEQSSIGPSGSCVEATDAAALKTQADGDPSAVFIRDEATDAAALKIQAVHRGKEVRKEVQARKKTMDEAALKIQALHRGKEVRKEVQAKKKKTMDVVTLDTLSIDLLKGPAGSPREVVNPNEVASSSQGWCSVVC